MNTQRPKTLVTGGAGFIGSHLVEALLAQDHEVTVIDNFFAGRREYVPSGIELVEMDLGKADEEEVFAIFRGFAPDAVVHLAAIHHIPYCLANPGHTFASNVRSTDVVVRALHGLPTRKLIIASTADVYANTDVGHVESDSPAPSNPYGLSKLLSEEIAACGSRINPALSVVVLRLFNVYGPRETNSHVIPRIIGLIRTPIGDCVRMGYLGGTRDFVHVHDVVDAIVRALAYEDKKFDTFNIGGGSPTAVRDVLEILMKAAGDHRNVIEDQARFRQFERKSLTADISKARAVLQWTPTRTLKQNLASLLKEKLVSSDPNISRLASHAAVSGPLTALSVPLLHNENSAKSPRRTTGRAPGL